MRAILIGLLLLFPSVVPGQEALPASPADLRALLVEAAAGNPAVQAARARLEGAREVPSQVQSPPDPEVSLAYVNDGVSSFTLGDSEFSTLSLTWTQELPYPGKLKRSGDVAIGQVDRAGKEADRVGLQVRSQVKIAYLDLYRLDRTRAILDETRSLLDNLAGVARGRYEVGQGIQENVFKAETEILRLEAEQARVSQERRAVEVRLNAILGRAGAAAIGPATVAPTGALPASDEQLAEEAVARSPEVAALEAAVRSGEALVDRSRLDLKPDFTWSASYQNRGGLDPMVAAMFGVRLPTHRGDKQAAAVSQAQSELLAARHDLTEAQVRARSQVRELVSRVERDERLVTLFEQGIIPQARGAFESARASYDVGRIGFLDLINDLVVLLNARIDLAARSSERLQSLAALEPLLDRDLVLPSDATGDREGETR